MRQCAWSPSGAAVHLVAERCGCARGRRAVRLCVLVERCGWGWFWRAAADDSSIVTPRRRRLKSSRGVPASYHCDRASLDKPIQRERMVATALSHLARTYVELALGQREGLLGMWA